MRLFAILLAIVTLAVVQVAARDNSWYVGVEEGGIVVDDDEL